MSFPFQVDITVLRATCPLFEALFILQNHLGVLSAGTKQVKYLESNAAAFFVKLSKEEVQYLGDIFKPDSVSTLVHTFWLQILLCSRLGRSSVNR